MDNTFGFPDIEMNFDQSSLSDDKFDQSFKQGDKVSGVITKISPSGIFVDINYHCEGIIGYEELLSSDEEWKEGEIIESFYLKEIDSTVILTTKMSGDALDESLQEAFLNGIPVEGRVIEERKGGFSIKLGGSSAFCPYSQIDLFSGDNEKHIGNTYSFIVTKFSDKDLVVSRRKLLEEQAEKHVASLQETLKVGDELEGTIRRIEGFGLFVNLGGVDGLVHKSELSWNRKFDLNDYFNVNDSLSVVIRSLDWADKRIGLGLREVISNPWLDLANKFEIGQMYKATITNLATFGAFVELEKGLEGLLHISKMSKDKRIDHPSELFEAGQIVDVFIENIDVNSERISLALEKTEIKEVIKVTKNSQEPLKIRAVYEGTIDAIKPFGVFVRLNAKQSGLLHISKTNIPNHMQTVKELETRFALGSKITVMVDKIMGDKVSLSIPESEDDIAQKNLVNEYLKPTKVSGDFGNAFDNLGL